MDSSPLSSPSISQPSQSPNGEKLLHLLLIACFAALFYSNSFGNFFVWNDWTLIIENFLIKDWRNLPEIFTSAFWKPLVGEPPQIYRPLVSLSFMADFSLWGLTPWGYHLSNVSFHVLNSILVYFLMRIYVSPTTAFMGSVLFAVHPIHTEAVTYISGRGEILMSFFLLSGVLVFLKSEERSSWPLYIASLPFFFFGLLARETAAIFPLLLLSASIAASPSSWKSEALRRLGCQIGPLIVLAVYYILRHSFMGMAVAGYPSATPDFFTHLLLVLEAIPLYLGLLLFPWNLQFLHPLGLPSPADFQIWLSVLLLAGGGWGFRYAIAAGHRAVVFALSWFLMGLLPLVYFIRFNIPLLEGWAYLPSVGFLLLASVGLGQLQFWSRSRLHIWVAILIAAFLGSITASRNLDWQDDLQISLHTFAASPKDPIALRLLGNASFRRAKTGEAEKLYREAIILAPEDPRLHESLGRLYSFAGRDLEALSRYQRVRELTPREPYPYWLLGRYYLRRRGFAEAERHFAEAAKLFPYSSGIRIELAQAYYQQGKFEQARAELEAALKIFPRSPVLNWNLQQMVRKRG